MIIIFEFIYKSLKVALNFNESCCFKISLFEFKKDICKLKYLFSNKFKKIYMA